MSSSEEQSKARTVKRKRALNVTPWVILGLIVMNCLQSVAFVVRSNQEIDMPPVYAAEAKSGSVTKLVALPYNSQEAIAMSNFAMNAITFCLNQDFANFATVRGICKDEYFSEGGWSMFDKALEDAGLKSAIISGRGIIKAAADGMPNLSEPGRLGTDLVYTIEIPIITEKKIIGERGKPLAQVATVMIARDSKPGTFDKYRIVQAFIEARNG